MELLRLHQEQLRPVTGCQCERSSGRVWGFYSVIKQQRQPSLSLFHCCVINLNGGAQLWPPLLSSFAGKVADKDVSVRVNAALWGQTFQLSHHVLSTAVKQPSCSELHVLGIGLKRWWRTELGSAPT